MSQFFTSLERGELEQMIRRAVHDEVEKISIKDKPEELIKAHEACEYLKISKVTLFKWIRENKKGIQLFRPPRGYNGGLCVQM